jgi:hypothetical protein
MLSLRQKMQEYDMTNNAYLYWVVLQHNNSEEWMRCHWFTGESSQVNPHAEIQNGNKRIKLTGESAQQFWTSLFQAIQHGEHTIHIAPNADEMKELESADSL